MRRCKNTKNGWKRGFELSEHQYFHNIENDESESERIKLQEGVYDPATYRHLETIGVAQGWKCLEVAVGAGSVAQAKFSNSVGPSGKIVATDLNLILSNCISAPNLEIRQHHVLKDELE